MTSEEIQLQVTALGVTHEEAQAQLAAIAKLEGKDEHDLDDCTIAELILLTKAYHDAAAPAAQTPFAKFLMFLNFCAQLVTPIATIATAFSSVFGVIGAAKSL